MVNGNSTDSSRLDFCFQGKEQISLCGNLGSTGMWKRGRHAYSEWFSSPQAPGMAERCDNGLTEKSFKGRISFSKSGGVQAVGKDLRCGSGSGRFGRLLQKGGRVLEHIIGWEERGLRLELGG